MTLDIDAILRSVNEDDFSQVCAMIRESGLESKMLWELMRNVGRYAACPELKDMGLIAIGYYLAQRQLTVAKGERVQ